MSMEVHINSAKVKSQAGNISVKDMVKNLKKLKNLKTDAFCWKIRLRPLGPGDWAAGVTYLWEYTHKVVTSSPEYLLQLYLVVHVREQLEYSSHIV